MTPLISTAILFVTVLLTEDVGVLPANTVPVVEGSVKVVAPATGAGVSVTAPEADQASVRVPIIYSLND